MNAFIEVLVTGLLLVGMVLAFAAALSATDYDDSDF